jgi:glutamate racemase
MKAGVFDSGIGGLSVTKSLIKAKLFDEIIYYGDTARVPYGTKDKNTIISYSLEAVEFFKNFDLDILIIACNSVSAYALNEIKQSIDIPVVGVIESGVLALEDRVKDKNSNILVIGTRATIDSGLYEKNLKELEYNNIISIPTALFVPLVEERIFSGAILDETMKMYFKNLGEIDAVILGCTHFPLIEKEISAYLNNAKTIHSGDAIVKYLSDNFNYHAAFDNTAITFFASSNPDNLKNVAKQWLKDEI